MSELMKPLIAPRRCRWCDGQGDHGLNAIDRAGRDSWRWARPEIADVSSSVLAFGVIPALSLGGVATAGGFDRDHSSLDVLLVAEASVVAVGVNQTVKMIAGRARPYARAQAGLAPDALASPSKPDDNLSFFSGHAAFSFALATSAGTIASLRGYRGAPVIWATAVPMAGVASFLRIAADKHYVSDVVVGAIVGAASGVLVPIVFHGREPRNDPSSSVASPLSNSPSSRWMLSWGAGW